MSEEEKDNTNFYMVLFTSVIIFVMILGIVLSMYNNYADNYDEMELKVCNDLKVLAGQYQKITAVDYHKKFFKDQCVIYVNKKEYDGHEFIRLVGLEQISILDAVSGNQE